MHFTRHTSPTRPITPDQSPHHRFSFKPLWMQKIHSIFVRDESRCQSPEHLDNDHDGVSPWLSSVSGDRQKGLPFPKEKERPITGLPRQATFKRQNSERRERLCPVEPLLEERRAVSASRHVSASCTKRRRTRSSPPPMDPYRSSAPADVTATVPVQSDAYTVVTAKPSFAEPSLSNTNHNSVFDDEERSSRPLSRASSASWDADRQRDQLQHELDTRWILNLSMHFRDKSDREKFFITYAETPTRWRRVTVSCDYRNAAPGSLERDLRELQFQRDKSLAVYEAIRESLPDIQFYETVTNLKLETSEGRLHVHVTEDVNEIIPYPARSMVRHILEDDNHDARPMELCEKDIAFDAHLSGFVYRVWHDDKVYIKKEIPSPDTIDEFLYEINALHALHHSENVIKLEAIILDDTRQLVKGLLLSFAKRGAVVDILYDNRGRIPWSHRELWARQAITGLRDVHEEGYVQGDFTLSNIVVDENNYAKIIDINRRGCPVGWEPPEIARKIASNQRISMYIGEKSDLYQLGMTLWALAMDDDEPERHDPPLMTDAFPSEVPKWFRNIVRICLSQKPCDRLSAKELVNLFPSPADADTDVIRAREPSPQPNPVPRIVPKQYIDPVTAVERDDIERFKQEEELLYSPQSSKNDWTFTYPVSSEYEIESSASAAEWQRGRKPGSYKRRSSIDQQTTRQYSHDHNVINSVQQNVNIGAEQGPEYDRVRLECRQYSTKGSILDLEELGSLDEHEKQEEAAITMTASTEITQNPPGSFELPIWRRSMSETTPRHSRIRLLSRGRDDSPDISPRSTTLLVSDRSQSAGPIKPASSSNDTVTRCDISKDEATFAGATCFSHDLTANELRYENTSSRTPSVPASNDIEILCADTSPRLPRVVMQDSGYDEPALHDMMTA